MWASVTGILTSGMVGIPVTIHYDEVWGGLRKNLVCRCSPWNSDRGDYRTILNVGEAATVAHEVMQHGKFLYLGVEGYSSDGKLVIPTRWAECGEIHRGANSGADISADPTLPIWEQLQTAIEEIKENPLTEDQLAEIQAGVQSAVEAAEAAKSAEDNARAVMEEVLRAHSDTEMLTGHAEAAAIRAEAAADRAEQAGNGSGQNPSQSCGMSAAAASLLITILRDCATYGTQTANIDALEALLMAGAAPDAPPPEGVTQTGSVLTITSGVAVTQDGNAMNIA